MISAALVIGSGLKKPFAIDKKVGIIMHQRSSHLQNALFNNVLGLPPGKFGSDILTEGKKQLADLYPKVSQIEKEKVIAVTIDKEGYQITTNKNTYFSKTVIIALNYAKPFPIKGLESYIIPHKKANPILENSIN